MQWLFPQGMRYGHFRAEVFTCPSLTSPHSTHLRFAEPYKNRRGQKTSQSHAKMDKPPPVLEVPQRPRVAQVGLQSVPAGCKVRAALRAPQQTGWGYPALITNSPLGAMPSGLSGRQ